MFFRFMITRGGNFYFIFYFQPGISISFRQPSNSILRFKKQKQYNMQRFSALDSFRGLAAIMIVFYHLKNYNCITDNAFVNNSHLFVNFFFVLSGFVIAYIYLDKLKTGKSVLAFLKNRIKRIYPLHVYTLLVFALFELSKSFLFKLGYFTTQEPSNNNLGSFLSSLFLMNATPVGTNNALSWNYPSWSISAEMIAYILFAMVLYCFRKYRSLTYIATAVIPFLILFIPHNNYYLLFEGPLGFFSGVFVFQIFHAFKIPFRANVRVATVLEFFLALLTIVMICFNNSIQSGYLYTFMFSCVIYVYAWGNGWISEQLKRSLFQKVGKYSFSIYLNHAIVIEIVNFSVIRFLKINGVFLYAVPFVTVLLTYLYSSFTYKYIECRFYKKLNTGN